MKKAIGYIRVSTIKQKDKGTSLEAQQAKMQAWADYNDFDLQVINGGGKSAKGKISDRKLAEQAIGQAIEQKAALVVYSLSRITRSTKEAICLCERLEAAGCDLISLSENIDTTTAAGKMVFRMMAVMAEFERDVISERTAEALKHLKANGKRVGTIPYGRMLHSEATAKDKMLAPCPKELKMIDDMKQKREGGMTLRQIRTWLKEMNVKNRKGNTTWRLDTISELTRR